MSWMRRPARLITLLVGVAHVWACAGTSSAPNLSASARGDEARVAQRFEALRASPTELLALVRRMPKGGDLHTHLSGAIYAESYIAWAADAGLCATVDFVLVAPPCDAPNLRAMTTALTDQAFYQRLIDAWSMRNWTLSGQSGHDHFFETFNKFGAASGPRLADMLAENATRAANGHVSYVEAMINPDGPAAAIAAGQIPWSGDFAGMRAALDPRIDASAALAVQRLRAAEQQKRELLGCAATSPSPGCAVEVRYIYQVIRSAPPSVVFAQMMTAFALIDRPDSGVVALNLVAPEDGRVAMADFDLHMRMLQYLRALHPRAGITLHAGELVPGLVPPEGLRFHIRESIQVGGATRIGHGVDVMHEAGARELLGQMARERILVEICLTSNDAILGVRGSDHPLKAYLNAGVPVALATDDEGVSRSEMSLEYMRAVRDQGVGYVQLKAMARDSLEHAFLMGASLWADGRRWIMAPPCAGVAPAGAASSACASFLASSDKARLQWALERDFARFEDEVAAD
jgi:adenosine deaminase